MIYHKTANKVMIFIAVMLMVFCIGGWFTGMATLGDDAMRNDPKVDSRVVDAFEDKDDKVEVIVILKEPVSGENKRGIQSDVLSSVPDFELGYKYLNVNALSGKLDKHTLNEIRFNPNVEKIYYNEILSINLDDSVPLIKGDYVQSIKFKGNYLKGKGQSVCVLDTGVDYTHPALAGRVILGPDYYNNDSDPMDDNNHGTHVAGIIASNDSTYTGVAPEASVVAVKVCDSSGQNCSIYNITAGIDWCINHSSQYNISVISMSLGDDYEYNSSNCNTYGIDAFVNKAIKHEIFVVASSGNNYHNNGISSPACITNVTSVNAVDKQDNIWDRGNTGEDLDLLAPGINIVSSLTGTGFGARTGTSMAAPHVAGAAALIYQHSNISGQGITPYDVKSKLVNNGVNKTDSDNSLTFPRIDVKDSILSCRLVLGGNSYPYPRSNAEVELYANYTNRTDGSAISGGNCSIFFDDKSGNMTYNATKKRYRYFRNFTDPGIYHYNVSCNHYDFENITETATIEILQGSENCTYPGSNIEWNITSKNNSICIGENLIINQSNINIEPGAEFTLNYTNLTLVGASTNYLVNVSSSAKFKLKNALIKGIDQNGKRLDIDLHGESNIRNSTFENSWVRFLGNQNHKIINSEFGYYTYFLESSENNIVSSDFNNYVQFEDNSTSNINDSTFANNLWTYQNAEMIISNSNFSGILRINGASTILNFTSLTSNLTNNIRTYNSPTIYGEVDMPSTGHVVTGNLTRFYPIQVYYNDGTTSYPNKDITIKNNNGSILFEGTTDGNGVVVVNLTLNTTNYGIGNFSVEVNPTEDIGLLTDTPITMQSSDSAPTPPLSNDGGGSSGGDDEECTEDWNCTAWGECVYGYQTRICTDLNECETEINKSDEVRECENSNENSSNNDYNPNDDKKDASPGDLLHIHQIDEENSPWYNTKNCCLWMICGSQWFGICWYMYFIVGFILIVAFTIWWYHKKKRTRRKIQKTVSNALGIDWTLKHLHLDK